MCLQCLDLRVCLRVCLRVSKNDSIRMLSKSLRYGIAPYVRFRVFIGIALRVCVFTLCVCLRSHLFMHLKVTFGYLIMLLLLACAYVHMRARELWPVHSA